MKWKRWYLWWGLPITAFFLTRLYGLTNLPVFADEAIYIRWSQMMSHEPGKYLTLPLYDGKTPLMMWVLTLFLPLTPLDPLWAARFMSVMFGFATMITIGFIAKELSGKPEVSRIALWLYVFLPWVFWHDRLALTDTPLVFFLALMFWGILRVLKTNLWRYSLLSGLFFGMAILTKLPAVFILLPLSWLAISWVSPSTHLNKRALLHIIVVGIVGITMLSSLMWSEWFPFLFQRSSDFTVSYQELLQGNIEYLIHNATQFFLYQSWYAGLIFLIPIIYSLMTRKHTPARLWFLAILSALPFIVTGKIVYSRYYLPGILFLIPAAAIALTTLQRHKLWLARFFLFVITAHGVWFMFPSFINPFTIQLPSRDREQYLTAWSAGFGIPEVRDLITRLSNEQALTVGTEGYFGTLPDGLQMYFDQSPNLANIEIIGVGQPLVNVPEVLRESSNSKPTYLFVNQDRLDFDPSSCCELVGRYRRPYNGSEAWLLYVKEHE